MITFVPHDELQYTPIYHISLNDENIDIQLFEKKLKRIVSTKFSEAWLPSHINYYNEPLKRMINTKLDIGFYQNIDKENDFYKEKSKVLKK